MRRMCTSAQSEQAVRHRARQSSAPHLRHAVQEDARPYELAEHGHNALLSVGPG